MKKGTIFKILPYISELKNLELLDEDEVCRISNYIRDGDKQSVIDMICSVSMDRQHEYFDTVLSIMLQE